MTRPIQRRRTGFYGWYNYDAAFIPIIVMMLAAAVSSFIMVPPRK